MRDSPVEPSSIARPAACQPPLLLTGATGYVGGRLLPRLQEAGRAVRCLARRPEFLRQPLRPTSEVVRGDLVTGEGLDQALRGVAVAYYLVHSLASPRSFEEDDRRAASQFVAAARRAGLKQIIYLGGLGEGAADLSPHLRSRQEVGRLLREGGIPVIEFRAGIVIGAGSFSYDMIRALVERLPAMVAPRWVATPTQPIAIDDLLLYLVAALDLPLGRHCVFEIGCADQVSYGEILREYARQRGLRRWIISLPVLTPRLSSLWLALVTPLYARVGRRLIEGLRNPTVVQSPLARQVFPWAPLTAAQAIARAIEASGESTAQPRWNDTLAAAGGRSLRPADGRTALQFQRTIEVDAPAAALFAEIQGIGGKRGWYYLNWLWQLRGALDLLLGGVGMKRGRPHPDRLAAGDPLDLWRVEEVLPPRLLRLASEMRLPGRAWLVFELRERGAAAASLRIDSAFAPSGLLGRAVWVALFPFHWVVLRGLAQAIARRTLGGRAAALPLTSPDPSSSVERARRRGEPR